MPESDPSTINLQLDEMLRAAMPSSEGAPLSEVETILREGAIVSDFRLVSRLASGGMGEVWTASQESLGCRIVALKFVRPDRMTPRSLELFAREGRAGGRLNHEGIVRVHDSGRDGDRAWIAMEFVGQARTVHDWLTELMREESLPRDHERRVAKLVRDVAYAMQAAHDARVVHRDLKPRNILLAEGNRPKVTDFGVAKLVDEAGLSRTGDVVGTYYYMSPEQATGDRKKIDARTDIFSLGVILYELLSLRRPFHGDTGRQIVDAILFSDPADPRSVRSRVPGDLVVIVGKCLEKDPRRRYASMSDLAADLGRFLLSEPIEAREPSRVYRVQRLVRRKPVHSVAACIALVSVATIAWQNLETARVNEGLSKANNELVEERSRLAAALEHQREMLGSMTPLVISEQLRVGLEQAGLQTDGMDLTGVAAGLVREVVLEPAAERARSRFADDPRTQALLIDMVADLELKSHQVETALEHYEEVQELADRAPAFDSWEDEEKSLISRTELAATLSLAGNHEEAERVLTEVVLAYESAGQPIPSKVLYARGVNATSGGRYADARIYLERSRLAEFEELPEGHPGAGIFSLAILARVAEGEGNYREAEELYRHVLAARDQMKVMDESTFRAMGDFAGLLLKVGEPAEGVDLCRRAWLGVAELHGENNSMILEMRAPLGSLLWSLGEHEQALTEARAFRELANRALGEEVPLTSSATCNLGGMLVAANLLDEGVPLLESALDIGMRRGGATDQLTLRSQLHLGLAAERRGDWALAEQYLRAAADGWAGAVPAGAYERLDAVATLGKFLLRRGRDQDAQDLLGPALEQARESLPDGSALTATLAADLAAASE